MHRIRTLIVFSVVLLILFVSLAPANAQPGGDYAIPGGRHFTQAGEFDVVDDGQARFWSEFQRLGLHNVGYPISNRFIYDGSVTQAFQKLVLQWRPEVNQAWPINVFDELSRHGFDDRLLATRQTPRPLTNFDPPGATWAQIVANRQALLNTNSAIRARYFSVADPLNVFGLPVSRVEDMGNHYAIRTQRAVFQQWKENVPWASLGQVTVANGGDIGKELGWLALAIGGGSPPPPPPTPTVTTTPPTQTRTSWTITDMLLGPGQPGRLYALQMRSTGVAGQSPITIEKRLMVSEDLGASWFNFSGGLPFSNDCVQDMTNDPTRHDALYATTCQGFYRWTGSAWSKISDQGNAVTPGNPQQLWALTVSGILISNDGGATWGEAASNLNAGTMGNGTPGQIIVAPGSPNYAYANLGVGRSGSTILRATPGGQWVVFPEPTELQMQFYTVSLDAGTGTLYLSATRLNQIWRITNPTEADVTKIRWERVTDLTGFGKAATNLLVAGTQPQGVALFVNLLDEIGEGPFTPYRSLNGGQSWQILAAPQ